LAVVNAQVQPPGGGCFGEPDWARWAFYGLAPLSVLAASAGAVAFALTLPLRLSMLLRAGFAFSIAVFWLVLLVLTLVAVEGPC
jgi:hypothetical protein